MSTYTEIREAVKDALFTINTANGYLTNILRTKFRSNYEAAAQKVEPATAYPKSFLTVGDHQIKTAVGRRKEVTSTFYITVVFFGGTLSVEDQVDRFAEDMDKMAVAQSTLNNKAVQMTLRSLSVDSGASFPEGTIVAELEVLWHKHY